MNHADPGPGRSSQPDETIDERDTTKPDDGGSDPFDCLAEEFAARCRRGETPSVSEYEERYPEHAEKVRKLLPTVAMMEQLKRRMNQAREKELTRSVPERLGEFRVLRELGRGGMGVVYEAVQESLGRHVALKVMHLVHIDARRLQRFQREAQAVAQLHHTNIVPIFAVGEQEGLPYYAMQYIRGSGLDALLEEWRAGKSLASEDRARFAAQIGRQAAEALQYAHEQGVLHRDVKPANLLVDEHQTVWITDFGLAKVIGHDDLTASGDVIGTLRYLAPEALRGETGPRGDIYSLGLTLYELLTLASPFGDLSPSELIHRVSEGELIQPRRLDPAIPRDLETIVLKAIARDPQHRYATAGALADDLRCFLEDRPILARRTTLFEHIWRWSRRNRATAALGATAVASLVLAAIVGWVGYASTTQALSAESNRRHEAESEKLRADENVALSLEVFGELFDKLTPEEMSLAPPAGLSGRREPFERGLKPELPGGDPGPGPPHGGPGGGPPPDRPGYGPIFKHRRDGGPPPDEPGGHPFGPGGPRGMDPGRTSRWEELSNNTELLQSILTFYDRFAQKNQTHPKLQGEAAWAYFKVGALEERLGHEKEAEAAYARAIAMFEKLAQRYPDIAEYRARLVEISNMTDPWAVDSASLHSQEERFLRAQKLVDQLVLEEPENTKHLRMQMQVHAKLGVILQRLGRVSDAEAAYRQSLAFGETLIDLSPRRERVKIDHADICEILAGLEIEGGRKDEARKLLETAVTQLQSLRTADSRSSRVADRFEGLAEAFEKLGDDARAKELLDLASAIQAYSSQFSPGPRGRGPRPPRSFDAPPEERVRRVPGDR